MTKKENVSTPKQLKNEINNYHGYWKLKKDLEYQKSGYKITCAKGTLVRIVASCFSSGIDLDLSVKSRNPHNHQTYYRNTKIKVTPDEFQDYFEKDQRTEELLNKRNWLTDQKSFPCRISLGLIDLSFAVFSLLAAVRVFYLPISKVLQILLACILISLTSVCYMNLIFNIRNPDYKKDETDDYVSLFYTIPSITVILISVLYRQETKLIFLLSCGFFVVYLMGKIAIKGIEQWYRLKTEPIDAAIDECFGRNDVYLNYILSNTGTRISKETGFRQMGYKPEQTEVSSDQKVDNLLDGHILDPDRQQTLDEIKAKFQKPAVWILKKEVSCLGYDYEIQKDADEKNEKIFKKGETVVFDERMDLVENENGLCVQFGIKNIEQVENWSFSHGYGYWLTKAAIPIESLDQYFKFSPAESKRFKSNLVEQSQKDGKIESLNCSIFGCFILINFLSFILFFYVSTSLPIRTVLTILFVLEVPSEWEFICDYDDSNSRVWFFSVLIQYILYLFLIKNPSVLYYCILTAMGMVLLNLVLSVRAENRA